MVTIAVAVADPSAIAIVILSLIYRLANMLFHHHHGTSIRLPQNILEVLCFVVTYQNLIKKRLLRTMKTHNTHQIQIK